MLHKALYCFVLYLKKLPLAFVGTIVLYAGVKWLTGWEWAIYGVPPLTLAIAYGMVQSDLEDIELASFKRSVEQMANNLHQ